MMFPLANIMRARTKEDALRSLTITTIYTIAWIALFSYPWIAWTLWPYWYLRPFVFYFLIGPMIDFPPGFVLVLLTNLLSALGLERESIYKIVAPIVRFLIMPVIQIMHAYDVVGIEKIPLDGKQGALLVSYHALMPTDIYYFQCWLFLRKGLVIGGVVDRIFSDVPLIGNFLKIVDCTSGGRDKLVADLRRGGLRFLLPGGSYEAIFSANYSLEWRNRVGFARVAKEANVPVIPMFTINMREFMTMHFFGFRENIRDWYLKSRIPIPIPAGGWPVKIRTYFGEPLTCGKDESAEEFAERVRSAVQELRDKYQRKSGSVVAAIADRFTLPSCD